MNDTIIDAYIGLFRDLEVGHVVFNSYFYTKLKIGGYKANHLARWFRVREVPRLMWLRRLYVPMFLKPD